ncbi:hypothetical protein ACLB2K_015029 [Fragaria x ananassa]
MSSPPTSLPPAAVPVTTSLPLPPSLPPALPPPSPQASPFVSPPFPPTSLPALPPAHNSIAPVSSPLPTVGTPPPASVTSPPPPSVTSPPSPSLTSQPPPSPLLPPTPLPSKPSPSPPPQHALSPPPLPTPKTPHLSPPAKPFTSPPSPPSTTPTDHSPPPTLSTPLPPVTTTTPPLLSTPSNSAPPPDLATLLPPAASTPEPPLTLAKNLPPSPSNAATPLSTTALPPPPLFHSPSPSLLPVTLQVQKPRPKAAAGVVAGCVIVGVVVVFLLLGIVIICYKRRSKKNKAVPEDYHKPASLVPKDGCYDVVQPHHNVSQPGVHVIRVLSSTSTSPMCHAAGSEVSYAHQPHWLGFSMDISNGTFTYDELLVATNGFSEANLLGQGGFGYVHKGVLPGGKEVAVKQLKTGSRQGEREFQAEVDIISRVHHKHLVSLVGHCIKGAERLLVYEFVPNNTLEFHLHAQTVLEWEIRLKIATGSAKGLAYLHEDCNPKIIHRDIKASNILVDQNFEAKVCDFGLANSFSDTNTRITHLSTCVVGTFGYLAPEYASSGKVTEKSDVYSYGVVLLELITGRPPISTIDSLRNEGLVQWARPLLTQALEEGVFDGLVDPRLETNYNNNEMARMVACAAACVRHSAWLRPRMSQIVNALEGVASLMDLREGVAPGNSAVYNGTGNSYYNSRQYEEDLKNSTVTMPSPEYGISRYAETTSEYGLNPSGSSSETANNRP